MSSNHFGTSGHVLRFGSFEADLASGQLRKRGAKVPLRQQSFAVLATLLTHPGQVVTRDDLRHQLWHDGVHVDFDKGLNTIVGRLRAVLGDSADHPRFIETLPKRGYRFIARLSAPARAGEAAPERRPRLVVLPFTNLSGDAAKDYFSDAMTDEMITELASLAPKHLAVIARTTAMLYKLHSKDVAAIGRELSVDYVVEGSVRHNEDKIGINVQLIQASDQTHLFAGKYSAALHDIFNLQNRIAQQLAAHISPLDELVRSGYIAAVHRPRKPTDDLTAYNEYIQGRYHLSKATPEAGNIAKQHLERAIACDPEFALAHDLLAELYWYLGYAGFVSPREAFSAGILHALRAVELDSTRAETHALLGEFHKTLKYNWPEVHREMALARQLDPDSPLVRMRYAVSELMPHGRLDEAVEELECALDSDPLFLMGRMWLGIILVLARRFQQAIEEGKKLLDLDPNQYLSYFIMGHGYRYQQRFQEALDAQRKAVELSGGTAWMLGWLGLTLASSGDAKGARGVLQRLHATAARGYVPPSSIAWIHLGLNEIDIAFEWLDRAVEECDQLMMPIKSYAFLDPIRSDPRFAALLRKMRLEA